jgi:cytochrome c2
MRTKLRRIIFRSIIVITIILALVGANHLADLSNELLEKVNSQRKIAAIHVNLNVEEIEVPVTREGDGGGLTSFGDELLLITHEGRIFLSSESAIEETRIAPPANGFSEYKAASESEKYSGLTHYYPFFRYNDILYYSEEGQHGLVVSYTEWLDEKECYGTSVAKLDFPSGEKSVLNIQATSEDWTVVYRTQPCLKLKTIYKAIEGHQAGGRISYRGDHKIILGSGDYAWDGLTAPESYPQRADNDYGKVLEIDLLAGTSRIVSIGMRNIQGVLVDTDDQIWTLEHGPRGGDELNLITEGGNYGWPEATLGTTYGEEPWPTALEYGRHRNHTAPTFSWVPSIGSSNLTQIQGFAPSWDGDLLVAALKTRSLYRLRVRDERVIFSEPIDVSERVRYVQQHTNGRIALWTDKKKILFLTLDTASSTQDRVTEILLNTDFSESQQMKIRAAIDGCAECHSFGLDTAPNAGAPGLGNVFGREIASTKYTNYSDALNSESGNWTAEQLSLFLKNPQEYAPGTTMPNPPGNDSFIIDGILEVLENLGEPEGS